MKKLAFLGVAAGMVTAVAAFAGVPGVANGIGANTRHDLFDLAMERVRARYVREVNDTELINSAINGMVSALDPHSSYLDPKEYAEMRVQNRGEFGGLGLELTQEDGFVKVVTSMDDTPAARAGIKSGDQITAIDGTSVQGMALSEAISRMRGPADSRIRLTVLHGKEKKTEDVTLTRAIIHIESVKFERKGDVGYIRLSSFVSNTNSLLRDAVATLKRQIGPAMKGYVIDMRNNPGGLLDQAIDVSDDFLVGGDVVSTRGRGPGDTQRYIAHSGDIADGKPIVLLVNEGTASASEIVAGALQDNARATVIGVTSFGKGSVQTIIPLAGPQGGALKLTTAKYYTPSGRSIQATGIAPNIAVSNLTEKEQSDADRTVSRSEATLVGHLDAEGAHRDTKMRTVRPEEGKKYDDFQLSYALDYMDGKAASFQTRAKPKQKKIRAAAATP